MNVQLRPSALIEHIVRNNMTQASFALKAGVSSGYLAQLLSGKRSPSGRVRKQLLRASKLGFDQLFEIVRAPKGF